jgi:hypothetical protein
VKYNPRLKALVVTPGEMNQTYYLIMYALKQMRESAGLPLDKYDRDGCLTEHDHAAIAIVELGINLGIDFDVTPHSHNRLDLTDV